MSSRLNTIEGATAMRQRPVTPRDALECELSDFYAGCSDLKEREQRVKLGRQYLRLAAEDGVVIELPAAKRA